MDGTNGYRGRGAVVAGLAIALTLGVAGVSSGGNGGGSGTSKCQGESVDFRGTNGSDLIVGSPEADVIDSGPGDDKVRARDGDDIVCGGEGDNNLNGGGKRDQISGNRATTRSVAGVGTTASVRVQRYVGAAATTAFAAVLLERTAPTPAAAGVARTK